MTKFVVDAYAWIEYLDGSEKGKKVAEIIEKDTNEILTSTATISEIVSKLLRIGRDFEIALVFINNFSNICEVSQEISISAGEIHYNEKKKNKEFGMLDSFVAATARLNNSKILTGDDDFKNFKEAIFI